MSLQLVLAIAPLSRLDGRFLQKPALPTIFVYATASYLTPAKTHRFFYRQRLRVLLDVQVLQCYLVGPQSLHWFNSLHQQFQLRFASH